jgi:hypothetical protein
MTPVVKAALIGGLFSGALDITAASVFFHANPGRVLQAVAAGFYGKDSFTMGAASMAVGAAAQEAITVVAALLYCLTAQRVSLLLRQWIVGGLLYGAVCNLVMTFLVVPLSHAHPTPFGSYGFWMNLAINTALYGTPIAFAARRYLRQAQ